jgi:hypothetical protein
MAFNNTKNRLELVTKDEKLYKRIQFESVGLYNFKGFDSEQELYTVNIQNMEL